MNAKSIIRRSYNRLKVAATRGGAPLSSITLPVSCRIYLNSKQGRAGTKDNEMCRPSNNSLHTTITSMVTQIHEHVHQSFVMQHKSKEGGARSYAWKSILLAGKSSFDPHFFFKLNLTRLPIKKYYHKSFIKTKALVGKDVLR